MELIDHGLEEIEAEGNEAIVFGEFTSFGSLSKAVEELGVEITKAAPERIANNLVEFTEEQMTEIDVLIDKLEDDEDVLNVFTNIG